MTDAAARHRDRSAGRVGTNAERSVAVATRATELVANMTLNEKIAQLGSCWIFELLGPDNRLDRARMESVLADGIGHITRVSGASTLSPQEAAVVSNEIQMFLKEETRLGVPAIVHEECLDGYMAAQATSFPQSIGIAASFDPELLEQVAGVAARQMRAAGAHQGLAPVLDVGRDPRWGRIEETYGEDPYLVAIMASAYVRGLQGEDLALGVVATAKHFVAHGCPQAGLNAAPVHLGERELRDVHLRPYEAAVWEANVQSFMHAYHEIDGVPCAANRWLLETVLRDELGFDGTVVSDYNGIEELVHSHAIADDFSAAACMALESGIDVELPSTVAYDSRLVELVADGRVDELLIDRAVTRVLTQKMDLGLFDKNLVDPEDPARSHSPADSDLAVRMATRSVVLAHHRNDVLPLSGGLIAVVGPVADDSRVLLGDYAYEVHIESLIEFSETANSPLRTTVPEGMSVQFDHIDTILTAMSSIAADSKLIHAAGGSLYHATEEDLDSAVAVCRDADVAVVVVGERSGLTDDCTCGEARDRRDITLPGRQEELIHRVAATGTPTVVVVVGGRPLALEAVSERVDAIVLGWLPGAHGAAGVARVLFGLANPGGKLPVTFPRHVGQVPTYYRHHPSAASSRWKVAYADGDNTPLWPFGHGLSYTTFEISDPKVSNDVVSPAGTVTVSCRVTNTGSVAGDEVVQLYIADDRATVSRPIRQLEGFARITLAPCESAAVSFTVPVAQLSFHNASMRRVIEPGTMTVWVGRSSGDRELVGTVTIVGDVTEVSRPPICGTRVSIDQD